VVNFTPRLLTFALFYIIKERENDKGKFNELEMNCNIKNIRDLYRSINLFKKGCQPKIESVKDKSCYLLADCHNTLKRWKNYFSHLLNVHGVNNVIQTEMHKAEP
jgi:hypothetical protein